MKTHKKTGISFRPLFLTTVVGFACQHLAMAQGAPTPPATPAPTGPTVKTSPFLPRPPQLYNEATKTKGGVPPNVMMLIDDSGSMQAAISGWTGMARNWATQWHCHYNLNNSIHWTSNPRCYLVFYIPSQYGRGDIAFGRGSLENYTFGQTTRMDVVIDGIHLLMNKHGSKINWSIYSLWGSEERWWSHPYGVGPGNEIYPTRHVRGFGFKTTKIPSPRGFSNNTAEQRKYVNSLSPLIDTPTTDRYIRAVRKVRDEIKYRCQKSYVVLLSDGDANVDEIPGTADERVYDNATGFYAWETALYGRFENSGNTDAKGDNFYWNYPPEGGWKGYRAYGAFENEPWMGPYSGIALFSHRLAADSTDLRTSGTDAEGGSWDDPKYKNQRIYTYTIGFGSDLSGRGKMYLRDGAACPSGQTCSYMVTTAEELNNAFDSIFANITNEEGVQSKNTRSTSTPSVSGGSIATIAASTSINTENWSSMMLFNWFDSEGKKIKAGDPIPAEYDNRTILVNNGEPGGIYNFSESDASHKGDFGLTSDQEYKEAFAPWLMRNPGKTDAQIKTAADAITPRLVQTYRVRTPGATDKQRQMGDVLGSPVIALGKDSLGKQKYVITAANDGMTYIFESTNSSSESTSPYNLALNYLPAGMQRESKDDTLTVGKAIPATAEADYGKNDDTNPHLYLNNGGIAWVETPDTAGLQRQYVLLGNMGQGGRGAYALSVAGNKRDGSGPAGMDAGRSNWLSEVPLWETQKGTGNGLGYTVGKATLTQVATNWENNKPKIESGVRLYAFLANGYQPGTYDDAGIFTANTNVTAYDATPTLYVYDMMGQEFGTSATTGTVKTGDSAGTLVTKIPTVGASGPGALASPTLVDVDYNGVIDVAYAGDQFGNLYRFDLRGPVSTWKAHMIYKGQPTQPITSAPAVYRKNENEYIVVFGTGSDLFKHDQRSQNQQMIMGIYDSLSERNPSTLSYNSGSILEQSYDHNATDKRYITDAGFNPTSHKAWRIMLNEGQTGGETIVAAEKVVSSPQMLLSTAFVSTRVYEVTEKNQQLPSGVDPKKTCYDTETSIKTEGHSWSMAINVLTGAGPDLANGAYYYQPNSNEPDPQAGHNEGVLTSAMNIIDTANSAPTLWANGANGNAGDGLLTDLGNPKSSEQRNDCLAKTAKMANVITKAAKGAERNPGTPADPNDPGAGNVDAQSVGGKLCGDPSLFRANEREIQL